MSPQQRRRRFYAPLVEQFEPRQLLAGDVTNGLIDKWTFDESSGNIAADSVGTNDASLINFDAADERFVQGRYGNAISFRDPSTNHIVETGSPITQTLYTISFWMRAESSQPLNPRLITPLDGFEDWVLINTENNTGVGFYQVYSTAHDANPPTANVWQHYAVTLNTTTHAAQVFRDGALAGTGTFNDTAPMLQWVFGHRSDLTNDTAAFNGLLDDIRVYNRILSNSEVQQLAVYRTFNVTASGTVTFTEKGAPVIVAPTATVANPDGSSLTGATLRVSVTQNADYFDQLQILSNGTGAGQINLNGTDVQYGGVSIGTLTSSPDAAPLTVMLKSSATLASVQALARRIGFQSVGEGVSNLQRKVQIELDDSAGIAGQAGVVNVNVNLLPEDPNGDVFLGLIHRWKLDESFGNLAADVRNGSDATLQNWTAGENQWVTGRSGNGLQFDGVDDLAFTPAIATGDFTVSFWLKLLGPGGINPRIVTTGNGNEQVCYNEQDNNGLGFFTNGGSAVDPIAPTPEVWTQYTVMVDRTNGVAGIYRDGQQVAAHLIVSSPTNASWVFGHRNELPNDNDTLEGVLDEIRIYNRILTGDEAQRLANFGRTRVTVGAASNYLENAPPVVLVPTATVDDTDSAVLNGSTLTVSISQNANALDQLGVLSDGTGTGQINRSGSVIQYEGTTIASLSTTGGASPLVFSLNSNATLAATQALVRHITFQTGGDNPSTLKREVQFQIDDSDGVAGLPGIVDLNVIAQNDAPVLDNTPNPTLTTILEDAASPAGDLVKDLIGTAISDADIGAQQGIAITGAFGNGHWQYSLNNGGNWLEMATPSAPSDSSALLLPADLQARVRFIPAADFNGAVKLWYRAWDQTLGNAGSRLNASINQGGTKTLSTDFENATLTIAPQNDAPVLDIAPDPTLGSQAEDAPSPGGTLVSTLLGNAVTDVDTGALRGIAIVGAPRANGTWQYLINNTSTWKAIPVVSETAAFLLPSNVVTRVRFLPNHDYNGSVTLSYRAWDRTLGSVATTLSTTGNQGGTKCFSTAVETASLTVTPVDDPPVLTLGGTVQYIHDQPAIVLAGGASVSDVDSTDFSGGRLRVRVGQGNGASNRLAIGAGFTVDGNNNVLQGSTIIGKRTHDGVGTNELIIVFNSAAQPYIVQALVRSITFKVVGNVTGPRAVIFTVSDGDGGISAEQTKTVNVS
jgi:hypothetical protein